HYGEIMPRSNPLYKKPDIKTCEPDKS
ncbi:uncharacterized protein METZ01_LOCUS147409, partial [marine metagenome]